MQTLDEALTQRRLQIAERLRQREADKLAEQAKIQARKERLAIWISQKVATEAEISITPNEWEVDCPIAGEYRIRLCVGGRYVTTNKRFVFSDNTEELKLEGNPLEPLFWVIGVGMQGRSFALENLIDAILTMNGEQVL